MAVEEKLGTTTMSVQEIGELMDGTVGQFIQKLQSIGGVDVLCTQILKTSTTEGLTEEDVPRQRAIYGGNTPSPSHVPVQIQTPSLSRLVWIGAWSRDLLLIRIQFFIEFISFISLILLQLITHFSSSMSNGGLQGILYRTLSFLFMIFPWTLTSYLIGWTNHKIMTAYAVGQGKVESGHTDTTTTFSVVRNGVKRDGVPKSDLVVGDLCPLEYGTLAPADGVLLNTGRDIAQDLRVYSGEFVRVGGSKMIVVAVGDNTVEARTAFKNNEVMPQEGAGITNRTSVISEKLNSFTWFSIKIAIIFVVVATLILIIPLSVGILGKQRDDWAMDIVSVCVPIIIRGVAMFSWSLPHLIPLSLVISLAVTCRRVFITNIKDGIFIRSMDNLTTFASATTLVIDGDCIDNTASDPSYIAQGIAACRLAGMTVRVLVSAHPNLNESFGVAKEEIYIMDHQSGKVGMIRSLTNAGEIVAFLSTGGAGGLEALNSAHVGIVMGHGAPSHGDIHLRTKNDFRALRNMLGRGRRVYEDMSVVFQFYIPALVVMCVVDFLLLFIIGSYFYGISRSQVFAIHILMFFIILGVIYNSEREDIPGRASLGKSRLDFTTTLRRKNICGQIIYQLIVLICLAIFSIRMSYYYSDLLLENGIAWMTLFNVFNAKKGRGERKVFEGLSFKHLFVWGWLICAILQTVGSEVVDATSSRIPMSIYQWSVTFICGLGTLAIYQLCCLIPIGRNGDEAKLPSAAAPFTAV